jgi:hypothetical protein
MPSGASRLSNGHRRPSRRTNSSSSSAEDVELLWAALSEEQRLAALRFEEPILLDRLRSHLQGLYQKHSLMMRQLGLDASEANGTDPFEASTLLKDGFQFTFSVTRSPSSEQGSVILRMDSQTRAVLAAKPEFVDDKFVERFRSMLPDFLSQARCPLPRPRWKELFAQEPSSISALEQQLAKLIEQALWALAQEMRETHTAEADTAAAATKEQNQNAKEQAAAAASSSVELEPWMVEHDEKAKASKKVASGAGKKKKHGKGITLCPRQPTLEETPKLMEEEDQKLLMQNGKRPAALQVPLGIADTDGTGDIDIEDDDLGVRPTARPQSKLIETSPPACSPCEEHDSNAEASECDKTLIAAASSSSCWQQPRRHQRKAKALTDSTTSVAASMQKLNEPEAALPVIQFGAVDPTELKQELAREASQGSSSNVSTDHALPSNAAAAVFPFTPPGSPRSQAWSEDEDDTSTCDDPVLVRGRYVSMPPLDGNCHVTHHFIAEGTGNSESHRCFSGRSISGTGTCTPDALDGPLESRGVEWKPGQLVNYLWGCTSQQSTHFEEGEVGQNSCSISDRGMDMRFSPDSEQATDLPSQTSWSRCTPSISTASTPFRHGQWVVGTQQPPAGADVVRAVQRRTFIDIDVDVSRAPIRKAKSESPVRKARLEDDWVNDYDDSYAEGEHWYFCWH